MTKLSIPLVGMHFRPPAKEVLGVLPLGTKLELHPEPTNQYDMNAVMVLVDMGEFPTKLVALLDAVLPPPYTASKICGQGLFHLGYLAASGAKTAKGGPGNNEALMLMSLGDCTTTLGSAPEGYPVVVIEGGV